LVDDRSVPQHLVEALAGPPVRQRHPGPVPPDQIGRIVTRQMIGVGADESIQSGLLIGCSHRRLPDQRYSQTRYRNQSAHGTPPGKEKNTGLSPRLDLVA